MKGIIIFHTLLVASFFSIAKTQDNKWDWAYHKKKFKQVSVQDGLSQSTVYSILQDSEGFMWFGTRGGGLNKYDGYEIEVFKHEPGDSNTLPGNEIISLCEDKSGNFWIGTRGKGLQRYHYAKREYYNYHADNSGLRSNSVLSMLNTSSGVFWAGMNSGLYIYNDVKDSFIPVGEIRDEIYDIQEGPDINTLYLAAGNKLISLEYDHLNLQASRIQIMAEFEEKYQVKTFLQENNKFWIGTSHGVYTLNKGDTKPELFSYTKGQSLYYIFDDTRKLLKDSRKRIWIGTKSGLYKLEKGEMEVFITGTNDLGINHNSIYSIYESAAGIIWIGTWGGGVNIFAEDYYNFVHFKHQPYNPESLSDNVVSSFAEDQNGIWVATELGGLNFLDYQTHNFKNFKHNSSDNGLFGTNHIKKVLVQDERYIWIGTFDHGLFRYDKQDNTAKQFLDEYSIFALTKIPGNKLAIGTMDGCFLLSTTDLSIERFQPDSSKLAQNKGPGYNFITYLFYSLNYNELWIGTKENGIYRYLLSTKNLINYQANTNDSLSISNNYITSITQNKNGELWISTFYGLNKFNPATNNFDVYTTRHGLPDNLINAVLCDENNHVWISTNSGISRFDYIASKCRNFNNFDGLQSNEFNRGASLKTSNGYMFFGGIYGFNMFHPDSIKSNNYMPPIIITDFKLIGNAGSSGTQNELAFSKRMHVDKITLKHNESSFTIDFVALNYLHAEKNKYKYKLTGFNEQFVEAGPEKRATYTNIDPGIYEFVVIASNNDGIWNQHGDRLKITILSPWWATSWAFVLYVLLITAIVFFSRKLALARIEERKELEYERKEKEKILELHQLKLRFFTDISHEFRTPLTLIASPVDQLLNIPEENDQKLYLYNIIGKNVKRLLNLVNQLMDFRKIENNKIQVQIKEGNLYEFIREIFEGFEEHARNLNIRFEFIADYTESENYFDRNIIDKTVFNLLSNAFKFTPPEEKITLELYRRGENAIISVTDTGTGISEEKLPYIFERFFTTPETKSKTIPGAGIGLSLTKRLVEIHKGTIDVESIVGEGTRFTVTFPINKSAYGPEETDIFSSDQNKFQHIEISDIYEPTQVKALKKDSAKNPKKKKDVILIVEDNDDLRIHLMQMFNDFSVLEAKNGSEAYKISMERIPDLILSDVMMPVMDGMEFCRKVKEHYVTSHIPVILLTAKEADEHKIEGVESGADAYIPKPFNTTYLHALVTNTLKQRKKIRERYHYQSSSTPKTDEMNPGDKKFLSKINKNILKELANPNYGVEQLSADMGLSRSQLFRKFRAIADLKPSDYIKILRLQEAQKLLVMNELNVNEITEACGFTTPSHFITSFKKHYGTTPKNYNLNQLNKVK